MLDATIRILAELNIPLVASLGVLAALAKFLHDEWRAVSSEREAFKSLFRRVNSKTPDDDGTLLKDFFIGSDVDRNCLEYVALDLDARRPTLLAAASAALKAGSRAAHFLEIVGPRQEGKTMLMGRLARDLALDGRQVYWCQRRKVADAIRSPEVMRRFSRQATAYGIRTRLYLFIDDVTPPNLAPSAQTSLQNDVAEMIDALDGLPITVTLSSVERVLPTRSTVSRITVGSTDLELSVSTEDAASIVAKWVEAGVLGESDARGFSTYLKGHKACRRQLVSFLSELYSWAASTPQHQFLLKFDKEFADVQTPTANLLVIAALQLLNIDVPVRVIAAFDPLFRMRDSVATLVPHRSDDDQVYRIRGPLMCRWVLDTKMSIGTFEQLSRMYSDVISRVLTIDNFGRFVSERGLIPLLLHRLLVWRDDSFDGRAPAVAKVLWARHQAELTGFFHERVVQRGNIFELLDWGRAFRKLGLPALVREAYTQAAAHVSDDVPLGARLNLVKGFASLKDLPDRNIAATRLKHLLEAADTPESARRSVFTMYARVMKGLGRTEEVLAEFRVLTQTSKLTPDSLMHQIIGELLESLGEPRLAEAFDHFRLATRLVDDKDPRTHVHALQRYGVFLSRHSKSGWPKPHSAFRTALETAKSENIAWEPIVVAWAKYQYRIGLERSAIRHYRRAVTSYRRRGIVESHAWEDLALALHEASVGDSTKNKIEAESLCREVITDDLVQWRSKLFAHHILGGFVGLTQTPYEYEGRTRPNATEAVEILDGAFESPPGVRDDPATKTMQDAETHRQLKDVYRKAQRTYVSSRAGNEYLVDDTLVGLLQREEEHGLKAFEGLPRSDTPGQHVLEHVLLTRDHFAFFLWYDRPKYFPREREQSIERADVCYQGSIELWQNRPGELRSWRWSFEPLMYLHYLTFRLTTRPSQQQPICEAATRLCEAIESADGITGEARREIRNRWVIVRRYFVSQARALERIINPSGTDSIGQLLRLNETLIRLTLARLKISPADPSLNAQLAESQRVFDRVRMIAEGT